MGDDFAPIRSTGIGSWPGTDFAEAIKIIFGECPELPYLPELPQRGAHAAMIGRGIATLAELSADLQPAGWRLTGAPGRDQLRARATLRDDLDQLEEAAQGYRGPFKLQVAGPWTLAASVERPRGDRLLADHGARREVTESLAEGISRVIADLSRRLPEMELVIQLDEPLLPAVLTGEVPTASGFSRHRPVEPPEVSTALSTVGDLVATAVAPAGSAPDEAPRSGSADGFPRLWVHSCAAGAPVSLITGAGIGGVALDLDQLSTADWEAVGQAMSDGMWFGAGAVPTGDGPDHDRQFSADQAAQRVLRSIRTLGLDPDVGGRMMITPACGLARFDQSSAVRALRAVRTAAGIVTDQLAA